MQLLCADFKEKYHDAPGDSNDRCLNLPNPFWTTVVDILPTVLGGGTKSAIRHQCVDPIMKQLFNLN